MLAILLIGCASDLGLFVYPIDEASSDSGLSDSGLRDSASNDSGQDDSDPPEDSGDTSAKDDDPRPPGQGQLVISELMINPAGVADETGEWIELYNDSDEGVDGALVAFSETVVEPGGFLVLCASETTNGGVDCQGTYLYQTFGGGFALSNSGDEVVLIAADYTTLDTFRYSDVLVLSGQSIGASPGCLDTESNDDASCWCPQSGGLISGDQGSPGLSNDGC